MRAVKTISSLLLLALALTGCAQRQAVHSREEGRPTEDVPNDVGGYAGSLAAPPETLAQVDVESNIEKGYSTDIRELPEGEKDPEAAAEAARKAQEALAQAAKEQQEANKPVTPDTSGDKQWESVQNPVVAVQTNKGTFYLELWPDVAPKHVENFLKLTRQDFYNGIIFHRVEPGFVVQGGDPLTKTMPLESPQIGTGGPGWNVDAEFSEKKHLRGTLAMARSADPNSAGSQFYICLEAAPFLDGSYTVFGQVLGTGMNVVDDIERGDKMQDVRVVHD